MTRSIRLHFGLLSALVLIALPSAASGQDRPAVRMQQQVINRPIAVATPDASLRAAQMQVQLEQSAKAALARSGSLNAKLSATQRQTLAAIGRELARNPSSAGAVKTWEAFIASMRPAFGDIESLVQWVLRESYLQQTEDLRDYADKVRHYNEMKSKLREELQRTSGTAAASRTTAGTPAAHTASTSSLRTRELEQKLKSVGDDAQLANVQLQSVLQKQQQTLQQMSSISKKLHDTAAGVIRNIRG
jgi:hypothetical protein